VLFRRFFRKKYAVPFFHSGKSTLSRFFIHLDLSYTGVTDVGMKEVKELKNLTHLDLSYAGVTDIGMKEIKELKNLTRLWLNHTQVRATGVKELQDVLPKCEINKSTY